MPLALGRSVSLCIRSRIRCRNGFDFGILRQPIECLVAAQLGFHPIERSLLCQTSAKRFRRFATMSAHVLELMRELFVGHVNVFRRRDAVDNQFCLHVILGTLLLPLPQSHPVHIHSSRINTLRRQRPHHALQPHVHLMLHERFGHREVVLLHNLRQDFLVQQFLVLMVALVLQSFANLLLQFVQGSCLAHVFREFVIYFRQLLGLDAKDFHGVVILFSGELGVRIVRRILHVKILVIARVRTS